MPEARVVDAFLKLMKFGRVLMLELKMATQQYYNDGIIVEERL